MLSRISKVAVTCLDQVFNGMLQLVAQICSAASWEWRVRNISNWVGESRLGTDLGKHEISETTKSIQWLWTSGVSGCGEAKWHARVQSWDHVLSTHMMVHVNSCTSPTCPPLFLSPIPIVSHQIFSSFSNSLKASHHSRRKPSWC